MRFLLQREPSLYHVEELHFAGVEYFVDVLVLPTMPRLILMIDRVIPFRRMIQAMRIRVPVQAVLLVALPALCDEGAADDDSK